MSYTVDRVIVRKEPNDQQFRASIIASMSAHIGIGLMLIVVPLLWPRTPMALEIMPVTVMPPAPAAQAAAPAPEPEVAPEEPAVEPEPQPEPPPPEPDDLAVPDNLEELRRQQEEEEREAEAERQRLAEEERRRREAEAERRRIEEEERRQREEEERRRAPQKAARRGSRPAQPQSAQRTGIDLTAAEDDERGFTVEEFPFAHYLGRIRDLIATQWDPPPRGPYAPQRRAEVFFRIGRNGQLIVQPQIRDASGANLFDRAAQQAIAQAAPFPPLPREYQGQSLGVGLAFVQE